jgi:hypothetical protein
MTPWRDEATPTTTWPNRVFLTIEDATHVTLTTSECALGAALSFLQNPVLPDEQACDSEAAPT